MRCYVLCVCRWHTAVYIGVFRQRVTFSPSFRELCNVYIQQWMTENVLKSNYDYTIIKYFTRLGDVKSHRNTSITYTTSLTGQCKIEVVILDKYINVYEHFTSLCSAAYYHLKNINCLKAFLTEETRVTMVHAIVTYHMDYCNSLLYWAYLIIISIQNSTMTNVIISPPFFKYYIRSGWDSVSISNLY